MEGMNLEFCGFYNVIGRGVGGGGGGYKVEEKILLGVRERKRLNIKGLSDNRRRPVCATSFDIECVRVFLAESSRGFHMAYNKDRYFAQTA